MTVFVGTAYPQTAREVVAMRKVARNFGARVFIIGPIPPQAPWVMAYETFDSAKDEFGYLPWIGVELDRKATPLQQFKHLPEHEDDRDVIYLTGSMNRGLPPSILQRMAEVVSVEQFTEHLYAPDVAMALVLYDRQLKRGVL